MINVFAIEQEIQTLVLTAVLNDYSTCTITNATIAAPSKFPCLGVVLSDNGTTQSMRDSSGEDKFHDITLRVDAWSNKTNGKQGEAEGIMNTVRGVLLPLNFRQVNCRPTSDINNATVYRLTAEFTATVDADNNIYFRK